MKKIFLMALAALSLTACDSFLEREPLDFGDENSYYNTVTDLQIAANAFYEYLPKNKELWGGIYTEDCQSDNQAGPGIQALFYKGEKRTVKVESSDWNFSRLRAINFFINKIEGKLQGGGIKGNEDLINQYLGEGYFFRAYDHFRLLRSYGDCPILTEMLPDDASVLSEQSKRYPRNEVARFILADLDKAAELMLPVVPEAGRVSRDAAYALKSRVALYEATWEKYHRGTCFVPGNDKWPGKAAHPDFKFKAGSDEAEYNWFFEQAYDAAEKAVDQHPLAPGLDGYLSMFNSGTTDFGANHEVILARYYKSGVNSHSCSTYLQAGGGCNLTRAAVNTYIMQESGKPYYADPKYQGDKTSYAEFMYRDPRLGGTVRAAGEITVNGEVVYKYRPYIYNPGNERATTGYELNKWLSDETAQRVQTSCTTAVPLLRSAEQMLNYLEAYYERHGQLGGKCDEYWRALRDRFGNNPNYQITIDNTDLSKENDLAVWSKGQEVDKTLYNIRRERRCELMAEGLRLDDLKRWRSLDNMVNYQIEGFNLWDEMYNMYQPTQLEALSSEMLCKYLRPLQYSATSKVYEGYTFPKQHYLEPIPISQFLLTNGVLYQNPGWPDRIDGTAIYTYDCD